jgi:hypothetical protein
MRLDFKCWKLKKGSFIMRIMRKSDLVLACAAAGLSLAMATLPGLAQAQTQPQPPAKALPGPENPAAPRPPGDQSARALFDIWAKQAGPMKKNMDDAAKRLNDANTGIQQAEQVVDELLKSTQEGINAGSDASPFMTELRKSIQQAGEIGARAAAQGDTASAEVAKQRQGQLKGYEADMNRLHGDAQRMMRELLARKDSLVRLKELEQLDLAVEVARQAVKEYGDFVKSGMDLLQSLSRQKAPGS